MALFGVVVVLLLLNLLIARFAKTFDMVYENVDANFKVRPSSLRPSSLRLLLRTSLSQRLSLSRSQVAFARVVVEGRKKELLPPPLNLISELISLMYDLFQRGLRSDLCQCVQCLLWPVRWLIWNYGPRADDERSPHQRLDEDDLERPRYELGRPSSPLSPRPGSPLAKKSFDASFDDAPPPAAPNGADAGADGGADGGAAGAPSAAPAAAPAEDESWVAQRVHEYIVKAVEVRQGERGTLLDQVVHYVSTHWFDIGREEQWRTDMTRQIGHAELLLGKVHAQTEALDKRFDEDMLVRRIVAQLQTHLDKQAQQMRREGSADELLQKL